MKKLTVLRGIIMVICVGAMVLLPSMYAEEGIPGIDGDGFPDEVDADRDGDGVPNLGEAVTEPIHTIRIAIQ